MIRASGVRFPSELFAGAIVAHDAHLVGRRGWGMCLRDSDE